MKQITLPEWAKRQGLDPPPTPSQLRRWARECRIFPVPKKYGREYRVREDARYVGSDDGSEAA